MCFCGNSCFYVPVCLFAQLYLLFCGKADCQVSYSKINTTISDKLIPFVLRPLLFWLNHRVKRNNCYLLSLSSGALVEALSLLHGGSPELNTQLNTAGT